MSQKSALSIQTGRNQTKATKTLSDIISIGWGTNIDANQALSKPNILFRLSQPLVRHRWWVFAILVLIITVFEAFEHPLATHTLNSIFWVEVLLFIGMLLIVAILLEALWRAFEEKDDLMKKLDVRHKLSLRLSAIQDWDELTTSIVQFPASIVPLFNASLFLYREEIEQFELLTQLKSSDPSPCSGLTDNSGLCSACTLEKPFSLHTLDACYGKDSFQNGDLSENYCLPLIYGDAPLAVLQLCLPQRTSLTAEQTGLLNSIGLEMAVALAAAKSQRSREALTLAGAADAERRGLARDLHDTLAQNLSYLRLKLEQAATDGDQARSSVRLADQEKMSAVANESYELVRGTLATLHPENYSHLDNLLLDHGEMVSERASFKIQLTSHGEPVALDPKVLRQIFFIFREGLSNVEKHARAGRVQVDLLWGTYDVTLRIQDDGQGFDVHPIERKKHFGLDFMRQRVQELNGHFSIHSTPGIGTELIIQIPILVS